jgi:hypothetical protein
VIIIPLSAVPSQTLAINIAGQACRIALRSNGGNLYFDLTVGGSSIVSSKICRNRQRLLLGVKYRGFIGDFIFDDTQGDSQPSFSGLNTRWLLYYVAANE